MQCHCEVTILCGIVSDQNRRPILECRNRFKWDVFAQRCTSHVVICSFAVPKRVWDGVAQSDAAEPHSATWHPGLVQVSWLEVSLLAASGVSEESSNRHRYAQPKQMRGILALAGGYWIPKRSRSMFLRNGPWISNIPSERLHMPAPGFESARSERCVLQKRGLSLVPSSHILDIVQQERYSVEIV